MKTALSILMIIVVLTVFQIGCGPGNSIAVRFPNGKIVNCEIADTPKTREVGLSEKPHLAPENGMIFVYPEEQYNVSFWMPNKMKFRLDLIFLDSEKTVVLIEREVPICESNISSDCDSYGPAGQAVQFVVEVVAGFCDEAGLSEGEKLAFELP